MDKETTEKVEKIARKLRQSQKSMCETARSLEGSYKSYIADVVCDMLRRGQTVTFETLISECSRRCDALAEEGDYELSLSWNAGQGAISYLQSQAVKSSR